MLKFSFLGFLACITTASLVAACGARKHGSKLHGQDQLDCDDAPEEIIQAAWAEPSVGSRPAEMATRCYASGKYAAAKAYLSAYIVHAKDLDSGIVNLPFRADAGDVGAHAFMVFGSAHRDFPQAEDWRLEAPTEYAWYEWRLRFADSGFERVSADYIATLQNRSPAADIERAAIGATLALGHGIADAKAADAAASFMMETYATENVGTVDNNSIIKLMMAGLWARNVLAPGPQYSVKAARYVVEQIYPRYWQAFPQLDTDHLSWLATAFDLPGVDFTGSQVFHESYLGADPSKSLGNFAQLDYNANRWINNRLQYDTGTATASSPLSHTTRWLQAITSNADALPALVLLAANPSYRSSQAQTYQYDMHKYDVLQLSELVSQISKVLFGQEGINEARTLGLAKNLGCGTRWESCPAIEALWRPVLFPILDMLAAGRTDAEQCYLRPDCNYYGFSALIQDASALDLLRRRQHKTIGGHEPAAILARAVLPPNDAAAGGADDGFYERYAGLYSSAPHLSDALNSKIYIASRGSTIQGYLCLILGSSASLEGWDSSQTLPNEFFEAVIPTYFFSRLYHHLGIEGGSNYWENFALNVVREPSRLSCGDSAPGQTYAAEAYVSSISYLLHANYLTNFPSGV